MSSTVSRVTKAAPKFKLYAGRKKLKTLVIAEEFGGQSLVSASIENWVGEISVSGRALTEKLEKHVRAQKDVETDLDVAVVGSGNSALEMVLDLVPYARKIYLLIRGEKPKGDPVIQEKVTASSKLNILKNVDVQEILGEERVTGLRYKDLKTGEVKELAVNGVFVAIGSTPNSDFIRHLVDTNQAGEILVDHKTAKTSKWGIFAAGDVTNDPFKQNNISAGDAVRAALSAYDYILDIQKYSPCAEREE